MTLSSLEALPKPRLKALLEHFAVIEAPREPWRVAHPLPEVLLLVVCGTVCDCEDYDAIADWGEVHLDVLRGYLPYHHGVPGGRWLTLLMNRIDPALFSAAFTGWVRETWPQRPDFVAIDGKTSLALTCNKLATACMKFCRTWLRLPQRRIAEISASRRIRLP